MSRKLTVNDLKNIINKHIENGGSVYDPKRQSPIYDPVWSFTRTMRRNGFPEFTMEDTYRLCGIDYDREYGDYVALLDVLAQHADEKGYVDVIKKITGSKAPKTLLKKMASQMGCSPSDYLILMTPYRYKRAMIATDYVARLGKELSAICPSGDATNIKRDFPVQYEKMRHLCEYAPEVFPDMQSVAEYFGLRNDRFGDERPRKGLNSRKVAEGVRAIYPSGVVEEMAKNHPVQYYKAARCAAKEGLKLDEWFDKYGLEYVSSQNTKKFAKTVVDSKQREAELKAIQRKIVGEEIKVFANPKDEYYYKKELAIKTILKAEEMVR